ncbi:hypothetical protein AWC38_SpisGene24659 [Stylophora pistillata]|uniref:Uncharacterized protein n=1 Tax=Stylophora pistillata TaxID=50429 RepID=A0A2B4R438_STYPI|nr:hypothetical protein AWC38_SpisGene24659 [Stylophora pistillata]
MGSTVTDNTNYSMLQAQIDSQVLSQKRFVPMEERRDTSLLPAEMMPAICSGDVFEIEKHFHKELLGSLPHPWFLSEDSHVNMIGVMEHFHKFMQPGDYICIEDTNPTEPEKSGQGLIKELGYKTERPQKISDGPSRQIRGRSKYTDFYG